MSFSGKDKFDSFLAFQKAKQAFEKETSGNFVIVSSKLLHTSVKYPVGIVKRFVYSNVHYKCKFHGEPDDGGVTRNSSNCKLGCTAHFKISLGKDAKKNWISCKSMISMERTYVNHEAIEINYLAIPRQRRKSVTSNAAFVENAIKVKAGIRQVHFAINTLTHKEGNVLMLKIALKT